MRRVIIIVMHFAVKNIITVTSRWARWRFKSPASLLFTQPFVQAQMKETSKLRDTGFCEGNSPVTGEFSVQKVNNAGNVSIWWRHHGTFMILPTNRARRCSGFPWIILMNFVKKNKTFSLYSAVPLNAAHRFFSIREIEVKRVWKREIGRKKDVISWFAILVLVVKFAYFPREKHIFQSWNRDFLTQYFFAASIWKYVISNPEIGHFVTWKRESHHKFPVKTWIAYPWWQPSVIFNTHRSQVQRAVCSRTLASRRSLPS